MSGYDRAPAGPGDFQVKSAWWGGWWWRVSLRGYAWGPWRPALTRSRMSAAIDHAIAHADRLDGWPGQ